MIVYADTGFLISAYGRDVNSAKAHAVLQQKVVLLLTVFGEVEFANAVALRVFRSEWTRDEARSVLAVFSQHQRSGVLQMMPFAADIWDRSLNLADQYTAQVGVRTLDILHVASALVLKAAQFYTFDNRQAELARLVGLRVLP